MDNSQFLSLLKEADNEYATIAEDGIPSGDVTGYIDTGSFTLNALWSGSIYGGMPNNKATALAGEPSTGKTFYALAIVRNFLKDNPRGFCFYFESEGAVSKKMLESRDVDTKRIAIIPVGTIEGFRSQALRILDRYLETPEDERLPMVMVLDSLGNLSSEKEIKDISEGNNTRDMTKSQLLKGAFRVLRLKLGIAKVAMIVTNHVYDVIGSYVPMKKMSGGSGLEFAADTIGFLSKKKKSEGEGAEKEITGVIITVLNKKARITIENKRIETFLNYTTGLDRYYGLLDLSVKFGIVKKLAKQYEFPDGRKAFGSVIESHPEEWFTDQILDLIDAKCRDEFEYGKTNLTNEDK